MITATRRRRRGFGRNWMQSAANFARSQSETTTQSIGVGWEVAVATDSGHLNLTPGEPNRANSAEMSETSTDLHPQ